MFRRRSGAGPTAGRASPADSQDLEAGAGLLAELRAGSGLLPQLRVLARNRAGVAALARVVRASPVVTVRLTGGPATAGLLDHPARGIWRWTGLRPCFSVLDLPGAPGEYLRGKAMGRVRTNVRRAREAGLTVRPVSEADRARLRDVLRSGGRLALTDSWEFTEADRRLHVPTDDWWVLEDGAGEAVGVAVVATDGCWAHLRILLVARDADEAGAGRWLLHAEVVEDLVGRGVGHLFVGNALNLPPGLRYFQRRLGYQVAHLWLRPARAGGRESAVSTASDAVNRDRYRDPEVVGAFASVQGWCDPGERTALLALADRVRGGVVLDVGVGGGRTTPLLGLLAGAYTGVDYSPDMVAACRRAYPGVRFAVADARDLADVGAGSVDLVVFSYNGLDMLSHPDRSRALAEFHRVLRPGGYLLFSTLNRDGPLFGMTPWRTGHWRNAAGSPAYRLAKFAAPVVRDPAGVPRGYRNWWRNRRWHEDHREWAVSTLDGYDFSFLAHYVTPRAAVAELAAVGLTVTALHACEDGRLLDPDGDSRSVRWFYVTAVKPAAG